MSYKFNSCNKLPKIEVQKFETKNVNDFYFIFNECRGVTSLDVSNFNTRRIMIKLTSLDISNFYTRNVIDMANMFQNDEICEIKGIEKLNTTEVIDLESMFQNCKNL